MHGESVENNRRGSLWAILIKGKDEKSSGKGRITRFHKGHDCKRRVRESIQTTRGGNNLTSGSG